jgi:protocatechuate 3,4-dioxygenase alpha subunit
MSSARRFTPEATVGPFFPGAFVADAPQDLWTVAPLVAHHPQGQPIVLAARFIDALRRPIPSLVVEVWQANAHGRYRHPEDRSSAPLDPQFDGFARLRTDDDGRLRFATIKPGAHPVVGASGFLTAEASAKAVSRTFADLSLMRAPHLRLTIFASGIDRVVTQIFFDDEALNATDPVLNSIPDSDVRRRLIARRTGEADGVLEYAIEVVMRGDGETPFFDDWA